jgi:hypothetical protein
LVVVKPGRSDVGPGGLVDHGGDECLLRKLEQFRSRDGEGADDDQSIAAHCVVADAPTPATHVSRVELLCRRCRLIAVVEQRRCWRLPALKLLCAEECAELALHVAEP